MVDAINIGLTGLISSSLKINASASNIANARTIGSLNGEGRAPYSPVDVVDTSLSTQGLNGGVSSETVLRQPAFVPSFAPNSPFADENGIVGAPNVNLNTELVNTLEAEQAFKANAFSITVGKEINETLIDTVFDEEV